MGCIVAIASCTHGKAPSAKTERLVSLMLCWNPSYFIEDFFESPLVLDCVSHDPDVKPPGTLFFKNNRWAESIIKLQ